MVESTIIIKIEKTLRETNSELNFIYFEIKSYSLLSYTMVISMWSSHNKMKLLLYCCFCCLLFLFVFTFSNFQFSKAYAIYEEVFVDYPHNNKTIDDYAKNFWQWWMTVPTNIDKDPITGLDECITGSDSTNSTVFLFNSYLTDYSSSCTINSNQSILVPLLVGECDPTVPELRSKQVEDLWKCAADADEVFKYWDVTLDGKVIFEKSFSQEVNPHLKDQILVRNSSVFTLHIPKINHYDAPEGKFTAAVDGYYLHINPLSPGEHIIKYRIYHEDKNVIEDRKSVV